MNTNDDEDDNTDDIVDFELDKVPCFMPTIDNPFMNITVADLMDDPDRAEACDITNPVIANMATEKFNEQVYFPDPNDLFNKKHEQRQFYTMPSTTIPNKQTDFARFLYDLPETCKENQQNCLQYEDLRFTRYNPYVDKTYCTTNNN